MALSTVLSLVLLDSTPILAQSGSNNVIRACVSHVGTLRLAGPNDACRPNETLLMWNVQGPLGPAGPTGATGPAGPEGPAGRDGRDAQVPGPPPATVNGQMTVHGHAPTPIFAFTAGATNPGTIGTPGGGAGAGKVSFSDLKVQKMLDAVSVALLKAAATGQHFQDVKIELFEINSNTAFATYTLQDAFVTSDLFSASVNGVMETVSFDFAKLSADIVLNGTAFHTCFDVVSNASC